MVHIFFFYKNSTSSTHRSHIDIIFKRNVRYQFVRNSIWDSGLFDKATGVCASKDSRNPPSTTDGLTHELISAPNSPPSAIYVTVSPRADCSATHFHSAANASINPDMSLRCLASLNSSSLSLLSFSLFFPPLSFPLTVSR